MNMTTGCCGPQMRPLWAMLGGLLALAALGGIIAGIVLGVKSTLPPPVRKLPYVGPIGSVRYYQQNGAFEPCLDRFAKTTPTPTTPRPTTPRATTTAKPTVLPTTTHCVPITIGVKPTVPVTTQQSGTTKLGTTKITQKPTVPLTTVCIWTDPPPTTTRITTTVETTTTVPTTTTTLPPTTTTTLPFCDTLTTSYTLITLYPLPSPVIYSGARPSSPTGAGLLCLLLLAFVTKLSVD